MSRLKWEPRTPGIAGSTGVTASYYIEEARYDGVGPVIASVTRVVRKTDGIPGNYGHPMITNTVTARIFGVTVDESYQVDQSPGKAKALVELLVNGEHSEALRFAIFQIAYAYTSSTTSGPDYKHQEEASHHGLRVLEYTMEYYRQAGVSLKIEDMELPEYPDPTISMEHLAAILKTPIPPECPDIRDIISVQPMMAPLPPGSPEFHMESNIPEVQETPVPQEDPGYSVIDWDAIMSKMCRLSFAEEDNRILELIKTLNPENQ
jgi:hypothetical protein